MLNRYLSIVLLLIIIGCQPEEEQVNQGISGLNTEKVLLVVIDGPRFTETWGDPLLQNIPIMAGLASEGLLFQNFLNDRYTFTVPGHAAICTGNYEDLTNDGAELPYSPSIFQRYLAKTKNPPEASWIITSKAKLAALGNSRDLNWHDSFTPRVDALNRTDSETLTAALSILGAHDVELGLVHFRGPDHMGHAGDWEGYLDKIREDDQLVGKLWDFLQQDNKYKDKTTMLVTNDHGRHSDGIVSGFVGHGDSCEGCQHISLLVMGPDVSAPRTVTEVYRQVDLAPTIAQMLNFEWEGAGTPIQPVIGTNN